MLDRSNTKYISIDIGVGLGEGGFVVGAILDRQHALLHMYIYIMIIIMILILNHDFPLSRGEGGYDQYMILLNVLRFMI
jgi:hypothetical protein